MSLQCRIHRAGNVAELRVSGQRFPHSVLGLAKHGGQVFDAGVAANNDDVALRVGAFERLSRGVLVRSAAQAGCRP